ncbi:DUF1508 domain-containing protein [Robertkochia aurantiaca]|uniref:DUF1508 domain-containing protein n=1 Tax=Robertkochia aurantiaca TaxID=2873700 RepID=UPI001CCC04EF|nr:DUF1508 domain-containing protein [Robertkochia sp. 3YJGBD-33]
MGLFVISQSDNGTFKFSFTSRRGKTLLTSISCKYKADCELIIESIKNNIEGFVLTRKITPGKKHFFRLSHNGLVLANSRKYTTPLRLEKCMEEILQSASEAEILDFSENEVIFPEEEEATTA